MGETLREKIENCLGQYLENDGDLQFEDFDHLTQVENLMRLFETHSVDKPSSCTGVSLAASQAVPEPNQQNGGWISVKDRLPNLQEPKLVYNKSMNNYEVREIVNWDKDNLTWYNYEVEFDIAYDNEYWMELPKPPLK